ncbi:MAG: tyrosine-type recombinase/integrase [Chitinophagales bacterium]|nr:tyrosine-type recombinase/integrase [Chitinophagales bacterium]
MHLKGFLSYIQFEKRFSKHTLDAYRSDLSQFSAYIAEKHNSDDKDLTSITHRQIRSWVVHLMNEKRTPKSVNRKISTLKTYYKYLLRKGAIKKNPMLKVVAPKVAKPLPLFIDKKSIQEIFNLFDKYPASTEKDKFIRIRDLFIVELLYGTGIRRSELLGLKENSFDLKNKTIRVLGKGNKEWLLPMVNNLKDILRQYLEIKKNLFGDSVFLILSNAGQKAYPALIYRIIHKLLSETSSLSRKSPHILRHTFATHLSNNGAELNAIKELLGHASLASTQIYTHNTIDKLKEIHRLAHPKA